MTIRELREMTGLSQVKFAKKYHIPMRSIQNWESSEDKPNYRECPVYVLELLEFRIKHE